MDTLNTSCGILKMLNEHSRTFIHLKSTPLGIEEGFTVARQVLFSGLERAAVHCKVASLSDRDRQCSCHIESHAGAVSNCSHYVFGNIKYFKLQFAVMQHSVSKMPFAIPKLLQSEGIFFKSL